MCAYFTFTLLLWHHSVAQSQQPEELLHCRILQFNGFNQAAVIKLKLSVTERVEGKVHTGCFLKRHGPRHSYDITVLQSEDVFVLRLFLLL